MRLPLTTLSFEKSEKSVVQYLLQYYILKDLDLKVLHDLVIPGAYNLCKMQQNINLA